MKKTYYLMSSLTYALFVQVLQLSSIDSGFASQQPASHESGSQSVVAAAVESASHSVAAASASSSVPAGPLSYPLYLDALNHRANNIAAGITLSSVLIDNLLRAVYLKLDSQYALGGDSTKPPLIYMPVSEGSGSNSIPICRVNSVLASEILTERVNNAVEAMGAAPAA